MARGLHDLESHVTKRDCITVLHGDALKLRLGPAPEMDGRTGLVTQLDVTRDEVGMKMCEENIFDRVPAGLGVGEILIDVALRIDHRSRLRLLVGDHVRRMRQASEVILLNFHGKFSGSGIWMGR